ncbi:MAG: CbtA family protein [Stellaceae bacterium]
MTVFRRLVWVALCAGLVSGLFATAEHQLGTVPVILRAEGYEKATPAHHHASIETQAHSVAWEPQNGVERTAYTFLADILTGIGFALLLSAGLALRGGQVGWRSGLFWGLAGFATFTIAPSLGLPPELPGTEAAPLLERQLWWLATVAATGGGLALLAFAQRAPGVILGAILIVLPHLYGAPQPGAHIAAAPEALGRQFVVAVTVISFLFWLILGASTGYFYERFQSRTRSL